MIVMASIGKYTKHYYAGSSRIASRIGGGFVPHKDLNDYSPVATAHRVPLLQTSSYDHKAENLRNLWARAGECMGVSLEYAYSLESSGLYLNPTETADGERYFYHSDHLGSSAFVTTEMRSIREDLQKSNTTEQNGYATQFLAYMPYGETLAEQQNGTSYYSPFKFSAKEKDTETGYSYFGARYYSPELSVWLSVDPLADQAPGWTPYNAMWNNPIKFIDPDGRWAVDHIDVTKNDDGTYKVVGGQANSDKNIYVVDGSGKRTGEVLGQMLTEYSFHHEDGSAVVGANINLNDQSGQNFFNNEIKNIGLIDYISNAKGTEPLDFKHRGLNDRNEGTTISQHHYRGMSFEGKIASARDIGNYSAGYVAGVHGFSWGSSRFAFDALQTKQEKGTLNTVLFYPFNRVREGQPTQLAERAGHNLGYSIFKQRQFEREWKKATNPYPVGPKW